MSRSIWRTLGVSATHDQTAIRRAYAARLRVTNPEDDPEGFQTLRAAYDQAMRLARHRAAVEAMDVEDADNGAPAGAPAEPVTRRRRTTTAAQPLAQQADQPVSGPVPIDPRQETMNELDRLCERLHALAAGEAPSDEAAIREAGAAVLASPALEEIAVHGRVDGWLQGLIAYNLPRTDPLIDPAATYFGWAQRGGRLQTSGALEHILQRQEDVHHRRRFRSKDHTYSRPFRLLEGPPRKRSPGWWWAAITRENDVREFLRHLSDARETLFADLNQESLAWWRARLTTPHFGVRSLWATLAVAGIAFLGGLGNTSLPGGALTGGLAAAVVSGGAVFALLMVRLYAFEVLRFRWREEWRDVAPVWAKLGWAPAGLAVLLVAGLLPAAPLSLTVIAVFTLAMLLWARAVAPDRPRHMDATDAYGPLLWTNAYLFPFWLLMLQRLEPEHGLQVAVPLVALAVAGVRNTDMLGEYWRRQTLVLRQRFLMAVGGAIALAALLIALAGENLVLQATAAALTGGIVLALRPPALPHPVEMLRVRYITNGILAVVTVMAGPMLLQYYDGSPWLVICGVLLLAGALMSLAVTALAERAR